MKKCLYYLFLLFAMFYCNALIAQVSLTIDTIIVKSNVPQIDLYINALYQNNPWKLTKTDFIIVSEKIGTNGKWNKLQIQNIESIEKYRTNIPKAEDANFIFLLDVSTSMTQNSLKKAKNIIKNVVDRYSIDKTEAFTILPFSDFHKIHIPLSVNAHILDAKLNTINLDNRDPWLYGNVDRYINRFKNFPGKTIVLLISPGIDKSDSTQTIQKLPKAADIIAEFPQILKDYPRFYIYPIAVGDSTDNSFLSQLPTTTQTKDDEFASDDISSKLNQAVRGIERVLVATHHLIVQSQECVFRGEKRFYKIEQDNYEHASEIYPFSKGSLDEPFSTCYNHISKILLVVFYLLIGLAILGLMLGIFVLLLPPLRKREFMNKYVKPYHSDGNRRHFDQLTNRPIEEGVLSVYKCTQVTPLQTWIDFGNQCPNYPNCLNNPQFRCDGSGAPVNYFAFFDMQDPIARKLNWLFFGAVGGYIGLTFYLLIKELGFIKQTLYPLFQLKDGVANAESIEMMINNALIGACFGMGLLFMLSWVEERGQSRRISWPRILFRTFSGLLMSSLIFAFGFYLQSQQILGSQIMGSLATWIFFGLGLGLVLSIRSTIPIRRALMGGLISGLIAFVIRLLITVFSEDVNLANVFALIALGAILGFTLVTIISILEDFELEYLAPSAYRRIVPISRWLMSGAEMTIGTSPQANIYIKWSDDSAVPIHAKLTYENNTCYLTAFAETLINSQIVPEQRKTLLHNGDLIQLGRYSTTQMRYLEKRKDRPRPTFTPPPPTGKPDGKAGLGANIERK